MLIPKTISKSLLCAIIVSITGLISCVDNKYDLGKIDTDDAVIGDELVVPLGKTAISTESLFDAETFKELTTDPQGNYIITYSDDFPLNMPTVKINSMNIDPIGIGITLPPMSGVLPVKYNSGEISQNTDVKFSTTSEIARLDSVTFEQATITVTTALNNIKVNTGSGTAKLKIVFPKDFELQSKTLPSGATFSGGILNYTMALTPTSMYSASFSFDVKKAKFLTTPQIGISTQIEIPAGANITVSSNPKISVSAGVNISSLRAVYGEFNVNETAPTQTINMEGLSDIFQGTDNVLSFADPRIKIETTTNIGLNFLANAFLVARNINGEQKSTSITDIAVYGASTYGSTTTSKLWIGAITPSIANGYTFRQNSQITELIKIMPSNLTMKIDVRNWGNQGFFPGEPSANAKYIIELPLSAAADFTANINQSINDIFDEELVDYLFSSGEVVIRADIANEIPLNFDMKLIITNSDNKSVGIDIPSQKVAAATSTSANVSNVSFAIDKNQMPRMETARNITIALSATGTKEGASIRPSQNISMTLKVEKKGGINIKQND